MKIIKICGQRASGKTTKAINEALRSKCKYIVYICSNSEHKRVMKSRYDNFRERLQFLTYDTIIELLRKRVTLFLFKNSVVIYELSESEEMLKNHDILFNFFNNEGVSEMIFTEKTDGPLEWKIIEN